MDRVQIESEMNKVHTEIEEIKTKMHDISQKNNIVTREFEDLIQLRLDKESRYKELEDMLD